MKIVILDAYTVNPGDVSWDPIAALGELKIYDRTAPDEILTRCQDADIVLTNKVPFSRETLVALPRLRFIGVLATGYNIIDTKAARQQGVIVTNIPAYSTASVAQITIALLTTITNRVEHYTRQIVDEERWSNNPDFCYWDTPLIELSRKRLGVYGMGRIGSRVSMIAMAMGMEVVTCSKKAEMSLPAGVIKVSEPEFWSTSDVITLHCPLTPVTMNLINSATIAQMKDGAILINTSRGQVIEEHALAEALRSGHIAAFGADVVSHEPIRKNNPLLTAPNVFLTPHIAWATREARLRLISILADNVSSFIKGNPINVVD